MSDESPLWYADLAGIMVYVVLVTALIQYEVPRIVRIGLAIPLVLFFPGYALISVLYPRRTPRENVESQALDPHRLDVLTALPRNYGINGIERLALSVVMSITVVPLLVFGLNFTPLSLTPAPIIGALGVLIILLATVALVRRLRTPSDRRFTIFHRVVLPRDIEPTGYRRLVLGKLRGGGSAGEWAARLLLTLSIVIFAGSIAYAASAPPAERKTFTEAFLVAEDEGGNLTTDSVPREFTQGESEELVLGLTNHEHERVEYVVVVKVQRISDGVVSEEERQGEFSVSLAHGETRYHRHDVRPTMRGENLRLTYLIYRDSVPPDPGSENAYRHLRTDISVQPADGSENT